MPHASCNSGYHHVRSSKPHSPPHTSLQLHIHSLHSPSCRMWVDRINGIRFIFSGGALGENLKGEFSNAANESFFATVSQRHGQTEGNSKIDDKY
ncbi:hypothetical protein HKD37_06G016927 [Glycine soja]